MRQRFTQTLPLIGTLCLLIIGSAVLFKLTPADAIMDAQAIAEPPTEIPEDADNEDDGSAESTETVDDEITEDTEADVVVDEDIPFALSKPQDMVDQIYFEVNDIVVLDKYYSNDVYVAGNTITVTGTIEGDLFAAGNSVTVDGDVMGSVRVAGSEIEINRQVGRNVLVFAESVDIAGTVLGDVTGSVDTVKITGQVYGEVDVEDIEETQPTPKPFITPFKVLKLFISWIGLMALGLVVLQLFPKQSQHILERMRTKPGQSFGYGALLVFLGPAALLILTVTLIGLPLAIVAGLLWIVLILIAKLYFGTAIGQLFLPKSATLIWPFVLGFSLLYLVTKVIGWFGWAGAVLGSMIMLVGIIWAAGSIVTHGRNL